MTNPADHNVMSFGDHLEDLRNRLVWIIVGVVLLFVVGLIFGDELLTIITAPLLAQLKDAGQPQFMIATSPVEAFGAFIKVAFVGAILVAMPWGLYQVWLFISPGLYPQERRFVYFLLPMSMVLTALGVAVLYFVLLPISLFFLISFGAGLIDQPIPTAAVPEGIVLPQIPTLEADPTSPQPGDSWINLAIGQYRVATPDGTIMGVPLTGGGMIAQQYRISEYINLVFMLGIAFAIAFQVPLVLMLLSWVGLVEPDDLKPYRKQIVFGCALGSALMPTQDPWSMLILSSCLYGLFEFGLILMKWMPARRVARGFGSTDSDEEA